jgi:hypothetical protein
VPRKNNRRDELRALDEERAIYGLTRVQSCPDGRWYVRNITVPAAVKAYRCPGCDQEIGPGIAHLVAWPADERGAVGDRRHWHTGCWRARDRRAPTAVRARPGQGR